MFLFIRETWDVGHESKYIAVWPILVSLSMIRCLLISVPSQLSPFFLSSPLYIRDDAIVHQPRRPPHHETFVVKLWLSADVITIFAEYHTVIFSSLMTILRK